MEIPNIKNMKQCIETMRIGDSENGIQLFLNLLQGLQQCLLQKIKENDKEQYHIINQLQCLLEGMEKRDIVLLADILEYEILPMFCEEI